MTTTQARSRADAAAKVPRDPAGELEWWQRLAARRDAFAATHPRLVRVVAVVRAVLLWVSVVWLGVLLVAFPELRPGMRAWVGCLWIVLVWFALARLRTLTLRGYMRFFVACVGWSVVIGLVTTLISVPFGGVLSDGPGVGIASWTEETLKLVPLAALVVVAPRRVSRFAVADWLVLGIAAGAAFLAVEEYLRRTSYTVSGGGIFGLAIKWAAEFGDGDGLPAGFVRFGPGLLPREASDTSGSSPGHVVATATVTVCVGLAIAVGRKLASVAHGRPGSTRVGVGVGVSVGAQPPAGAAVAQPSVAQPPAQPPAAQPSAAEPLATQPGVAAPSTASLSSPASLSSTASLSGVPRWVPALAWLLPLGALALAVYDHAGWNASAYAGDRWLDGQTTTAPLVLRLFWSLTGHGEGRAALLALLVGAAVLVDGARYARAHRRAAQGSACQDVAGGDGVGERGLVPPAPAASSNPVVAAVVAVWRQVGSDVRFAAAARVKQPGERRLVAVARGRVVAQMCRTQRELLLELARGDGPVGAYRVGGLVALGVLAVGAFVLGPLLAAQIGPSLDGSGLWLAAQLEGIGEWFSGLSFGQQVVVGIGIAALVALSGGSLGLALGVSGVATYLMAHGQGAGAFVRDPQAATRSYLATRSPAEMAWDVAETVLTFAPGNFAGAAGGRWVRAGAQEFARDPAAWRATQRQALRGEAGAIDLTPFTGRGGPGHWNDPAVRRQWVDERLADPNVGDNGMRRPARGEPADLAFQVAHAGPDEIRLLTPESTPIWADGVGVYDDAVAAVETKFVRNPGGSAINEGNAPAFMRAKVQADLDDELVRYAAVMRHGDNPVSTLRLVGATPASADFLLARARAVMGPGMRFTMESAADGAVVVVVRLVR